MKAVKIVVIALIGVFIIGFSYYKYDEKQYNECTLGEAYESLNRNLTFDDALKMVEEGRSLPESQCSRQLDSIVAFVTQREEPVNEIEVSGSITVMSGFSGCRQERFPDIRQGTLVRIEDIHGENLAAGKLSKGEYRTLSCKYSFELSVPDNHDMYIVEVGRRGENAYSKTELLGGIHLTLQ